MINGRTRGKSVCESSTRGDYTPTTRRNCVRSWDEIWPRALQWYATSMDYLGPPCLLRRISSAAPRYVTSFVMAFIMESVDVVLLDGHLVFFRHCLEYETLTDCWEPMFEHLSIANNLFYCRFIKQIRQLLSNGQDRSGGSHNLALK